jgi:GntR family transcriptional regulator of vanillate catabolism
MSDKPIATRIRQMILQGELKPGERLTETGLAERLGLSRTPIRGVLPSLAAEGFLDTVGRRGFAVAQFSDKESFEALELRALLEGQAARMVARDGASPELIAQLEACLAQGDALFEHAAMESDDWEIYGEMNERFHTLIVEAAGSTLLASMVERLNHIPFVTPSSPVFTESRAHTMFTLLFRAHGQHHALVDAIRDGDGARAEALFREHANAQRKSMTARGHSAVIDARPSPRPGERRRSPVAQGRRPLTELA